jgi:nucleoid DNA-binding protein
VAVGKATPGRTDKGWGLIFFEKKWKYMVDGNSRGCHKAQHFAGKERQQQKQSLRKNTYQIMNKAELIEAVQKSLSSSKADAERAVAAVIDSIKIGVKKDKVVQLIGFGTFKVAERAARMGVNPKTGEKIKIKKSKTVKFAVGKEFKSKI